MPDIQQVKQDVAAAVKDTTAATKKLVGVTEEAGQEAVKLRQQSLNALNREESWIEKNPGKVSLIVVGLIAIIIALLAKSCA